MKLENGRPQDFEARIEKEKQVYDLLESLNIEYARVDHEPAMTMEVCEQIDKVLGAATCKNLFLTNRQQTDFYLLLMPGDKPFKTKDISAQIGSARLSFASGEQMEKYLGTTPGSASVLGLMHDTEGEVRLLVDRDVLNAEYFGCHPCINTSSLKIKTTDVFDKIIPALKHTPEFVTL
ncbi:MAG: prolyl-tRNA synthetase associated domain-containing protein [Oscillospiraceae bacterium]|nr:prolyl-tRNA synthetase associated domain-containing protein [Oscillospiraceae bacterium]